MNNSSIYINKLKRKLMQHVKLLRLFLIIIFIIVIIIISAFLAKPVWGLINNLVQGPKAVTTFFRDPLYTLPSYEGRTNILFVGMGGANHDGAELTDTIIFISLDLKNTDITMLSIPRDIWVPSLNNKINAAYMIGKQKSEDAGFTLLEDAVYEITDQPLHYIIGLDFDGFEALIDAIGGIKVNVDRTFVDYEYPIKGKENDPCDGNGDYSCRYETISFQAGEQIMNGSTALKYSRSRHAEGEEGTDYARSTRQRKVILAIKNKILSKDVMLNPAKLFKLKSIFDKYVIVDPELTDDEYAGFAGFGYAFYRQDKNIKNIILDQGDEENLGFLINPSMEKYNSWVLEPRSGSWKEFQSYFKQILKD